MVRARKPVPSKAIIGKCIEFAKRPVSRHRGTLKVLKDPKDRIKFVLVRIARASALKELVRRYPELEKRLREMTGEAPTETSPLWVGPQRQRLHFLSERAILRVMQGDYRADIDRIEIESILGEHFREFLNLQTEIRQELYKEFLPRSESEKKMQESAGKLAQKFKQASERISIIKNAKLQMSREEPDNERAIEWLKGIHRIEDEKLDNETLKKRLDELRKKMKKK